MPKYFAEVGTDNEVVRVVVADSLEWCADHLGGTWLETADPYSTEPQTVNYCGPGWGADPAFPERFAPPWVQPLGADVEDAPPYPVGALVFHNGRVWRSTTPNNVWEPGVSGWHDAPDAGVPVWVQPTGAHDAYPLDAEVSHNGQVWRSTIANNVWEPGVFGWVVT
jgi:hypothetical protein